MATSNSTEVSTKNIISIPRKRGREKNNDEVESSKYHKCDEVFDAALDALLHFCEKKEDEEEEKEKQKKKDEKEEGLFDEDWKISFLPYSILCQYAGIKFKD